MKVLVVVEDSQEMRFIIERTLRKDGRLELDDGAVSADEAIAAAKDNQPDLVILDHFIEGDVLGLQCAPLIKQVAPGAKILLFSDFDLKQEAAGEPAVDMFLPKKRLSDLLTTVQDLLGLQTG